MLFLDSRSLVWNRRRMQNAILTHHDDSIQRNLSRKRLYEILDTIWIQVVRSSILGTKIRLVCEINNMESTE